MRTITFRVRTITFWVRLSTGRAAGSTEAAWRAGLVAIVCIGETQKQRDAGQTLDICGGQLAGSLPDGSTAAESGGGL